MAKTPMMQQYDEAKQACGDALLLFRMGDFYELFHDDAKRAAEQLGLTLTSRDKGENPIPMAGFPYHQLDGYLKKLISAGFRAAVCEQVEDPKEAKGLVKREITRVVTPGTLTDESLLDPRESNYLAAIVAPATKKGRSSDLLGAAWCDLSTGRFQAAVFPRATLADQLARIHPSEVLLSDDAGDLKELVRSEVLMTERPRWAFSLDSAQGALSKHFDVQRMDGFGFTEHEQDAIRAAGAVLDYLQETQKASLDHIDRLLPFRTGKTLEIDEATWRSLELTRTMREGRRDGSLLAVLDRTITSMGARMLGELLSAPSTNREEIVQRQDAIAELIGEDTLRRELRDELKGIYDLQRLVARVTTGRCNPRDLRCVGTTLALLPGIKQKLANSQSDLIAQLEADLDLCPELQKELDAALQDDCPLIARDGGFIRAGYHAELDQLRELAAGGKQWIASYQAAESERTEVPMKVGFNKVFGYYIEVTNAHRDRVPETYIRKQTLKNAERYITPELKEYEEKVLSADDKAKELEFQLFLDLRAAVHAAGRRLQKIAEILAWLDALGSLAELARQRGYCRPEVVDEPVLDIRDGRHPVLDITEAQGTFVPNDAQADDDVGKILLITGPNMAGKSTYIRQVALLTIMAQMGSYVPAGAARIGIADRVFARVGASDELSRGQSTFMVEMTETARILNTATAQSLVILDEIGRGTSTYDGVSLAWAIVEHLHDTHGCRTLFATHYHELTDLASSLPQVRNLNVSVKEWDDNVIFLHKIVPGSADKSYGIHVARLAGVPKEVNERAKQILAQLESEHLDVEGKPKLPASGSRKRPKSDLQLTLFAPYDHPLLDTIRQTDLNGLTPLEALQLIQTWQNELADE